MPVGLHFTVSTKVNVFVTFINLGGTNVVIPGPTAFIVFKPFAPISVLTVIKVLLDNVLILEGIGKTLFCDVLVYALVNVPLKIARVPSKFLPISVPRSVIPAFYRFSFGRFFALSVTVIVFALLFVGVFSAINALINLTSGANVVRRSKRVPRMGRTVVSSTVNAAMKSVVKDSAVAACIRDTSNVTRNKHSKFASLIANILFLLTLFFTPLFLLVPDTTAAKTLMLIKIFVVSSVAGISVSSVSRTLPTFVAVVVVMLACSVTSKVILKLLYCMLIGLKYNGRERMDPAVCILTTLFVLGFVFT